MINLTKNQNQIISNLVAEFAKINQVQRNDSNNPLLGYANELDKKKVEEMQNFNLIEAQNNALSKALKEKMYSDADYLQGLINEVGKGLRIETEFNYNSGYISIRTDNLRMPSVFYKIGVDEFVRNTYIESIYKLGKSKITFEGEEYYDINEVINSGDFSKEFTKLLNR